MEIVIISIIAFLTAILTFFSGFGLGTILTPVFMVFFPVEVAIALTGIVHFGNNIFKLFIVGKNFNKEVLIRFGIPAVIFAFIGAYLLLHIPNMESIYSYTLFGKDFRIFPLKLIIAILMMIFAVIDLIPYFNKLQFDKNKLPFGGALSGFFGGLSGSQGALRSAFLIRAGLSKEAFIATTVIISSFVDFTRLGVYSTRLVNIDLSANLPLIISATVAAMCGAFIGNKLLKKVTLKFLQVTVAIMLIILSIALGLGLI
ncbi:sulfite exporter TauE/SafE family protein [uncultured Flavobacterium sp.]|mgnify:CR=1 FL=1|uniref:sulfite exporter TauE/SafE family protein n=1 Tax=uncultured Flavobacterium sp. TaxID=165435 RepID=UPI0030EEBC9B|tara:strand:+ start:342293 stop:343066 length:774 start_codon:yes stop_codon:yes gene_type:complete